VVLAIRGIRYPYPSCSAVLVIRGFRIPWPKEAMGLGDPWHSWPVCDRTVSSTTGLVFHESSRRVGRIYVLNHSILRSSGLARVARIEIEVYREE
jgi:hypothetical protein